MNILKSVYFAVFCSHWLIQRKSLSVHLAVGSKNQPICKT
jgi:hypothetical protein